MEFESEVLDVRHETHDVKTFRFSIPNDFSYVPGQFIMLVLDLNGKTDDRAFSISSSPTNEGFIEITKKIGASDYSQKLDNLNAGNSVKIKGPFGMFTFDEEAENVIFLAGGIGVTPFRCMMHYATDKHLKNKLTLFYSNKIPEDIAFKDEFGELAIRNKNLKIIYTITRPEDSNEQWSGMVGRIDEGMINQHADPNALYYIAGPPAMVDAMVAMVKAMSVPQNKIKIEKFFGY